jgi:uncharacterized protein YlaI
MRRSRDAPDRRVVCPACGGRVARKDAREYDKQGDRWDRAEKSFEYLCRPCHDGLSLQARDGLEALLCEAGAGEVDRGRFLERFEALSADRSESVERR